MNMAYGLATQLAHRHTVCILVVRGFDPGRTGVIASPVYTDRRFRLIQKVRLLGHLLNGPQADILQFFFAPTRLTATLASLALRIRRTPGVLTVTHVFPPGSRPHVFGARVVTYSAYLANRLRQAGVDNVVQIPPGVDEQALHPGLDGSGIGAILGIPPEVPVVLYAGEYGRSATIEALVAAVEICYDVPDVRFVFACRVRDSSERDRQAAVAARFRAAGWSDRVIMRETISQMRALIARADVCILPLRDTYGKVDLPMFLLEAMAMAKPIVVTDIPPLNELLADPVGSAAPVDDGPALAEAIQRMLVDGRDYGLQGRRVVEQRYALKQVASRYEALYRELI